MTTTENDPVDDVFHKAKNNRRQPLTALPKDGRSRPERHGFANAFLQALAPSDHGEKLFDYLPDVLFFIKDKHGRFVKANRRFLEHFGFKDESELVGKTDRDMVPPYLARQYASDDATIIRRGIPIIQRVELVTGRDHTINWYVTSKVPLKDKRHAIAGLAGITHFLRKGDFTHPSCAELAQVIDYLHNHLTEPISVTTMARLAHLALSALERKFKTLFHVSPMKYLQMIRVQAACKALIETNQSLDEIACNNGFYDQSHFSRTFSPIMGTSPKRYRMAHSLNLTGDVF
jgi:PAS domain S-box-containing protein